MSSLSFGLRPTEYSVWEHLTGATHQHPLKGGERRAALYEYTNPPKEQFMISHHIRVFVLAAAAFSPAFLVGQEPTAPLPSPAQPGPPSTQDSNTSGDTIQSMRDKGFLRKATEGSLAEVQFGRLAVEKGASNDVKSLGQMMIDDHTKLNEKMAPIADSIGVMLPKRLSKEDQAEYDKISALTGDEFDKEYIATMVKDHHADLREFRIEANSTNDPLLKQAVTDGAQIIHDHMVMIDKMARSKGIAIPGGHSRPAPPPDV